MMEINLNEFPANFLLSVLRTPESVSIAMNTKDFTGSLYYVIGTLSEREQDIIRCIYQKHMKISDVSRYLKITKNRISQIKSDILKKCRSAQNIQYLYFGISQTYQCDMKLMQSEGEKAARKRYEEGYKKGYESGVVDGAASAIKMQDRTIMPISVLRVSNRVLDDLYKYGLRTVGDLLCIENFTVIKDIGYKHNIDLINALKLIGIDCKNMEDLYEESLSEKDTA